eukprot:83122-Alexandrium_andersonii.AAC.1
MDSSRSRRVGPLPTIFSSTICAGRLAGRDTLAPCAQGLERRLMHSEGPICSATLPQCCFTLFRYPKPLRADYFFN